MKLVSSLVAGVAAVSTFAGSGAEAKYPPQPHTHSNISTYIIDLDLAPEERYAELLPKFNATVWGFWNQFFANDTALRDGLFLLADKRGKENDEQQREIAGMAKLSGLPVKFVQAMQMLYELQTLMVPVVNSTQYPDALRDPVPEPWGFLRHLPWRGPGCTGIIARNSQDGTVYHARNLDFSPLSTMHDLVYNAIFQKDGKELFRSQMIAGYTQIITGARMGPDGYAIERNTRYTDHEGGNEEMLDNLLNKKTKLNGWQLRKILETNATYDEAVASIEAVQYTSTEYAIVSGVQKGTIISRNPDEVAFRQVLGQPNFDEPEDYIIMTNFDFFWDDIRELFDPTGGKTGHPTRREAAQEILNASLPTGLTQDLLFETINAQGVIADTVFQAIINVEKGIWNVSQPNIE